MPTSKDDPAYPKGVPIPPWRDPVLIGFLLIMAAALALALTACHATPGLTLRCNGHCAVVPANLRVQPEPGRAH